MTLISRPNSYVTVGTGTNPQLSYGLQINPAPFTVSVPHEDPVLGSLEFVITNPTANALPVNSVEFTIQVGTGASITPSTEGIATTVSDHINWVVLGPPSTVTSGPATYTLQPKAGSSVSLTAGASVVVQIYQIKTNPTPGNSTINIKETVGNTVGFTSFSVTTFPAGFYFNSLAVMVHSGSALVPVAQVMSGTNVTLVWNSSVVDTGAFVIYYSSASQGQQTATTQTVGEWTPTPPVPLTSDTVFTVVVTVPTNGGQPLTASLSTMVSVQNPSLVAAAINTGQATVTGTLSANEINGTGLIVNGSNSVASLAGTLSVTGQTTLGSVSAGSVTAASLSTTGALSANAINGTGLNINGPASVASLAGTLSVTGQTTLGSVSAQSVNAGSLNVSGNAAITGGITAANAQIQFGQNIGINLTETLTYLNQQTGWYAIGWFNDPWFPYGPTAWLSGYGGFRFLTGGAMPAAAFSIDYHGNCTYNGTMQQASSIALKENIRSLSADEASDILNNLEPVQYTRKATPDEGPCLGFIAEHVPSAVASADGTAIVPDEIVAVLTRVVKDQQQVIEKLERKVNALEAKNTHRRD